MTVEREQQVAEATAAMLELYGAEGHLWDWLVAPDILPDVRPFALSVDIARVRRALVEVMILGSRVLNALAFGYWV